MKQREVFLWFRERACAGESFILGTRAMTFVIRVDPDASIFCVLHVAVAIHNNTVVIPHLQIICNYSWSVLYCDVNISFVASYAKTKNRSRLDFAEPRFLNDVFVIFFGFTTYTKTLLFIHKQSCVDEAQSCSTFKCFGCGQGGRNGRQVDIQTKFIYFLSSCKKTNIMMSGV